MLHQQELVTAKRTKFYRFKKVFRRTKRSSASTQTLQENEILELPGGNQTMESKTSEPIEAPMAEVPVQWTHYAAPVTVKQEEFDTKPKQSLLDFLVGLTNRKRPVHPNPKTPKMLRFGISAGGNGPPRRKQWELNTLKPFADGNEDSESYPTTAPFPQEQEQQYFPRINNAPEIVTNIPRSFNLNQIRSVPNVLTNVNATPRMVTINTPPTQHIVSNQNKSDPLQNSPINDNMKVHLCTSPVTSKPFVGGRISESILLSSSKSSSEVPARSNKIQEKVAVGAYSPKTQFTLQFSSLLKSQTQNFQFIS